MNAKEFLVMTYRLYDAARAHRDAIYGRDDASLEWQYEAICRAGGEPALFVGPQLYQDILKFTVAFTFDDQPPVHQLCGIPVVVKPELGSLSILADLSTMKSAWVMDKEAKP